MFSNNISVTFQQTKKSESLTYDTPSLQKPDTQLILSYNIILKLIIPILQPFGNIFPIFHKASNMKFKFFRIIHKKKEKNFGTFKY